MGCWVVGRCVNVIEIVLLIVVVVNDINDDDTNRFVDKVCKRGDDR